MKKKPSCLALAALTVAGALCSAGPVAAQVSGGMFEFTYAADTSQRDQFAAAADKDIAKGKAAVASLAKNAGAAVADAKAKIDTDITALQSDVKSAEATGLSVCSLIGLLGGPVGAAAGALTGTAAGAVRESWAAGVDLVFIEEATQHLQPGKVALVAEIEEEWVIPVDSALEAAGGRVLRRTRTEVAEAQFDHDVAAFKSEIEELESEASHASDVAKTKLQAKLAEAKASLDSAVHRAQQRVDTLKQEAEALKLQLSLAKGDVKAESRTA